MSPPPQAAATGDAPAAIEFRAANMVSSTGCAKLDEEQAVAAIIQGDGHVWVDIVAHHRDDARAFLEGRLGFHELAVEDALSSEERPALQEFDDHVFLVVPALVGHTPEGDRYEEVAFFLKENALVTVSVHHVPVLDGIFARWMRRPKHVGETPAELLHAIVDGIVDGYFPAVDAIEDEVDDLSDAIFSGSTQEVGKVLALKRRLLELRRRLSPVRDILNNLLRRDTMFVPTDTKRYFQDVFDHVLRLGEIADVNRDTLTSLLDVHLSTVSNNLNNVMRKMTVISTVLMTMALIAGIYGMNFKVMPELNWVFGYPFALGLMLTSGALIVYLFRRFRWL